MQRTLATLLLAIFALGCGATPPPKELTDARSHYARAEKGLAPQFAPADLDTAKQTLTRAEQQFKEEPESPLVKDLAYVADRHALLAAENAAHTKADRDRKDTENKYKEYSAEELDRARKAIESSKLALEKERERLKAADQNLKGEREARLALEKKLKAALDSLAQIAAVKEEARGVVITLSGAVLFASGQSTLLPIARDRLDQVYATLADQGHPQLVIEGHTDSTGSRTANMALSQQRADAVGAHLISKGYPSAKIKSVGIGPDRPVAENTSPDGRANNRRVEIVVSGKK
jgi:outer membrane protein OmpA-like peptidoglycan-associated protein